MSWQYQVVHLGAEQQDVIRGTRRMTHLTALHATQTFFATRAAGWEDRFAHDGPQYARAVQELAAQPGQTALDLGCGTGRALPHLRAAVGSTGTVIGLDATWEMLQEAQRLGRHQLAWLWQGDVLQLPLPDRCCDVIFAGGLLPHLAEGAATGLQEMARVCRDSGRLAIFHPISRVVLAARHGGVPSDDDVLAPIRLRGLLAATGWQLLSIEDAVDRYLALAQRSE